MLLNESDISTKEILAWEGLHLFHYDLSSCSQKVRILIGELGITYTSHPINLMKNEQRTDWYLGINSRGQVPVLVHDGKVHIESNDIIEYLNQHFAKQDSSLLPTTNKEKQQMHELMELEDQLHSDLRTVTFTYIAPDPGGHAPANTDENFDYIGRFHKAFTKLNEQLQNQEFLLGNRMTLADISWFITLYRLNIAGYPLQQHPTLKNYFERITQRPAFKVQLTTGPIHIRLAGSLYRRLNRIFKNSLTRDYKRWEFIE